MLEDFMAAFEHILENEFCNGKAGVVGFCFGGWISNMMAVRLPELAAAVPFYVGQPPLDEVPQIQAPQQLHYAGIDTRVKEAWPPYEKPLKENRKEETPKIYTGTKTP